MKKTLGLIILVGALAGTVRADNWKVDPVHTTVLFKVQHFGAGKFIGRFNDTSGKVSWDNADPSKSSIEVTVKVDSVDTNMKKRDDHLKSPDFFSSKEFPSITFKSTKIEKDGDKYKVTGDLTLHGTTKSVTAPFEITGEGEGGGSKRIGAEAVLKIKRTEFGMTKMVGKEGVGDDVEITIAIEATKE